MSEESDDDEGGCDVDDDAKCGGKLSGRMYSHSDGGGREVPLASCHQAQASPTSH